jgi:bacillithiol biosynthesis deacetylase BshB1
MTPDFQGAAVDVLALGPHPDDVELAVGGTLLAHRRRGRSVAIVDCTRGELGTRGSPEIRATEAAEAARLLGVVYRGNLGLPDGSLFNADESRRRLVRALRTLRPVVLLAPHDEDLHPDHEQAGSLARDAVFLAGVAKYEPGLPAHRVRAVLHYPSHRQFVPSFVVDITSEFAAKRAACLAYRSQFHDPRSNDAATYLSRPQFWDWWEGRARYYGQLIGAEYGEPFLHHGPLKVDDVVAAFENYGYYPQTPRS